MVRDVIPMDQFSIRIEAPIRRENALLVNVRENGAFGLNRKLAEKLGGQQLDVRFTPDYRHLSLAVGEGIPFPKGGSRKLPHCTAALKEAGIRFPAQYLVWQPEGAQHWQGDLLENPTKKPSGKRRNSGKG